MTEERRGRVAESALALIANLEDYAEEESEEEEGEVAQTVDADAAADVKQVILPDGTGKLIACAGGRGDLDDAAAAMLGQVLKAQGATTRWIDHRSLEPGRLRDLSLDDAETLVIVFLNPNSVQHARYMVRRLRRSRPAVRVGVMLWNETGDSLEPVKRITEIGSDFVSRSLTEAAGQALSAQISERPKRPIRRLSPARPKKSRAKQTA